MAKGWRKGDGIPRKLPPRSSRESQRRARIAIVAFLGGRCARCGFEDPRALQIDHVHGGGVREIKRLGGNRSKFYARILETPERYQLLCANCNWIKRVEQGEFPNLKN